MANPPPATRHVAELDGLRGVACLWILLWHIIRSPIATTAGGLGLAARLFSQTWSGVDLFFVLSGYLITQSLEGRQDHPHPTQDFLWSRAARIVPAYAVYVIAFPLLQALLLTAQSGPAIREVLTGSPPLWVYAVFGQSWYVVFTHHVLTTPLGTLYFAAAWTLSAEVDFYLATAALFVLVPRRHRVTAFACLGLLAVLVRTALVAFGDQQSPAAFILPPARMDAYALGAIAAYLVRSPELRLRAARSVPLLWWFLLAGVGLLTFGNVNFSGGFADLFSYPWLALFYTASLVWIVGAAGRRGIRFLARGPLAWLGIISYSVYLWHYPLHYLYAGAFGLKAAYINQPNAAPYVAGEFAVVLAVGAASYLLIEKPVLAWNRRREKRQAARA